MSRKKTPQKKRPSKIIPIVLILLVIGGAAFLILKNRTPTYSKDAYVTLKDSSKLTEKKPLLSPSLFRGKVAYAYRLAAEIPEIVDKQFCYCYCRKNHGHKTLLTCFTSNHGSKCAICMDEVIMASDLHKKGYSVEEITAQIDEKFKKIADKHQGFF